MAALSYQGISDQVAAEYMERHGSATWADIDQMMGQGITCPKLKSYWHFYGCRYDKISRTCSEPDHIDACPLPSHRLRNGRLNQMAYTLFLFIRDIADGDLVGWIDRQFRTADDPTNPNRIARLREALIGPLREVYGVSDKVLTMSLSCIRLAAPKRLHPWHEVGASIGPYEWSASNLARMQVRTRKLCTRVSIAIMNKQALSRRSDLYR